MTDEQIIKALECCYIGMGHWCSKCPFSKADSEHCEYILHKFAHDLINRQKAKIEELHSDKIIAETHERAAKDLFVDCTRQLEETKAEIERMENQNTLLLKKKCKDINTARKIIKSEAIKDFAKRLKIKVKMYNSEDVDEGDLIDDLLTVDETVEIIDELIKEMTEVQENVDTV